MPPRKSAKKAVSQELAPRENQQLSQEQRGGSAAFMSILSKHKGKIAEAAGKSMDTDRLIKIAMMASSRNPQLLQCTPLSMLAAVIDAAFLQLEPVGALAHAYLVPYRNRKAGGWEVQLQIGYKGMMALAVRAGIRTVIAEVIREGEVLEYQIGSGADDHFKHVPGMYDSNPPPIIGAWAKAIWPDGTTLLRVIDLAEINKAKQNSQSGRKGFGPWKDHYEAMVRKTAVRRLCTFLPQTTLAAQAASIEESQEQYGRDHASFSDLIGDGSSVMDMEPEPEPGTDGGEPPREREPGEDG